MVTKRKILKLAALMLLIWLALLAYVIWPGWSDYIGRRYWLYVAYAVVFPIIGGYYLLALWRGR